MICLSTPHLSVVAEITLEGNVVLAVLDVCGQDLLEALLGLGSRAHHPVHDDVHQTVGVDYDPFFKRFQAVILDRQAKLLCLRLGRDRHVCVSP